MTGNLPDQEVEEPLRTLRSVRRINPSADAASRALERALEAARQLAQDQHRVINWKRTIMRSGAAAAVLVGVAVVGWLSLGNRQAIAAPTWANVTQQTAGANPVHLELRTYREQELTRREDVWIKSPGMIRTRSYEPVDGKMVPVEGAVATPEAAVRWDERTRLAEHASTDNPYMAQSGAAGMIQAMLGMSLLADQPEANVKINGEQVKFAPVQQTHAADRTLRGFRLQTKDPAAALPDPFRSLVYWFDGRSNTLRRITATHDRQSGDIAVDLHPQLPTDWFEPKIPQGFYDVEAGVRPRLSPEVRKVYDRVAAARQRFGDYRAVIWRDGTGGWPTHREAGWGENWRCDMIDWGIMHAAIRAGDNPRGYVKIRPDDPFATLWKQVTRKDYEPEMTAMTWAGKYGIIHYKLSGRGPRVSARLYHALQDGYEKYFAPSVRLAAWPEWIWWENRHPHGWSLKEPPIQWRLLPPDPKQKSSGWTYAKYTLDRSKDWLCIRREQRFGKDNEVWTIEAFAQTPGGLWYPKRVTDARNTYDYSLQRGAAEPAFFAWPEGVPAPEDAFFKLLSPTRAAGKPRELPETAKGKFTAFQSRGLPRGFDDRATADAHSRMVQHMARIRSALDAFAHQHQWVFPENLQALVDGGYLEAKYLTNPLHPEARPPFKYIRPQADLPNRLERMVLYESFEKWPGVLTVMFQDGSGEHIHDRAEFEKLLREATAPQPPTRPDSQ
jgi:hypothetical protein